MRTRSLAAAGTYHAAARWLVLSKNACTLLIGVRDFGPEAEDAGSGSCGKTAAGTSGWSKLCQHENLFSALTLELKVGR